METLLDCFVYNDPATTEIYTLALHDALPILLRLRRGASFSEESLRQGFELLARGTALEAARLEIEVTDQTVECRCGRSSPVRSEEHTSELQSRQSLVCRLLLAKK